MRKILSVLLILLALAGCGRGTKLEKSLNRNIPDACQVPVYPPLIVPPDFYLPQPGEKQPVIKGKTSSLPAAEQLFLDKTGTAPAAPASKPATKKPAAAPKKTEDDFLNRMQ